MESKMSEIPLINKQNKEATNRLMEVADYFAATLAEADALAWRHLLIYLPKELLGLAQLWRPIDTAPLDGSDVLLYTTNHGVTQAHFDKGGWYDTIEGREHDGPVWVCGDDAWQIEVEWAEDSYWHAEAIAWQPVPTSPAWAE
jgi:hypothetical protein